MKVEDDPCLFQIIEQFDLFCRRLDDILHAEQKQLEACKKKCEMESKLAQELKLNSELQERASEVARRSAELDRVCAALRTRLTVADSDRDRLGRARELYEVGKELTGARFDFSAPPDLAKGYVASSSRRVLQTFECDGADGVWAAVRAAAAPAWPRTSHPRAARENLPPVP